MSTLTDSVNAQSIFGLQNTIHFDPTALNVQIGTSHTGPANFGAWIANGPVSIRAPKQSRPAARIFRATKRAMRTDTPTDLQRAKENIKRIAASARANGQTALYEEMGRMSSQLKTDELLVAAGYSTYINTSSVYAFMSRAKESIYFTDLLNFGRPIPEAAAVKIREARKAGIFSGIRIMHQGAAMIKTTAQRIMEKDPIAFGSVSAHPDRLYFICDWVDELCDMTLAKLITSDGFMGSLQSSEVDSEALAEEAKKRAELLETTNRANWMEQHARALGMEERETRRHDEVDKASVLGRLFGR